MNTWRKEFVRDEYKKIHDKLEIAVLMGEPINMDSLEELVLCAYIMGKQEADYEAYKSISFFQEMLGLKNRIK
jgi:hypothetical protein